MSITIPTKDLDDVHDKFRGELGYSCELEEGNERYIKQNLGISE